MTARTLLAVYFSYVAVSYFFFYLYLPTEFLNFFIMIESKSDPPVDACDFKIIAVPTPVSIPP